MRALLFALAFLAQAPDAAAETARTSRTLYEQWFRADADADGELSRAEAAHVPRLAPHFEAIDRNRDGKISADEVRAWRKLSSSARRGAGRRALDELLARADVNGDGVLDRAEAQSRLPRLARKFDLVDTDRNGSLTKEEIDAWLARRRVLRGARR